jgi:glycosyltransferase involved in cell wall biosynthesis
VSSVSVRWPRRTIVPKPRVGAGAGNVDAGAPRVSVVIPTYNRAALLPRAMRSVLGQTFADFELIVVDDAGEDGSADIAERCTDSRVRVVRLARNGGVSRALNEGIVVARGELVAFLGDDDEWLPELLERLVARLDDNGNGFSLVYSDARIEPPTVVGATARPPRQPEGDVLDDLLAGTMELCASACLVRRNALLEFGGFDETIRQGEDTDLWLRMASASHRFAVVREPLAVVHRGHGLGHLTKDPVLRAVTLQRYHRRWGRLARERLGAEHYGRRRRWQSQRRRREQRKIVKHLRRAGSRAEAWRYARRMVPTLPWGVPYVAQALLVAMFGPWPYRLRRAAKALARRADGKQDAPVETEK